MEARIDQHENDDLSRKTVRKRALSAARKRCGFTQDSFAEALGVDLSTVGRWECAARRLVVSPV